MDESNISENRNIHIIENTPEARQKMGTLYGAELVILTNKHIEALQAGKSLAWTDGEYRTFVIMEE